MSFQFEVTPPVVFPSADQSGAAPPASETVDLLRQILEVQREQLSHLMGFAAAHDMNARWLRVPMSLAA